MIREQIMRRTLTAALLAGAAALTLGTATAAAQPAPYVVGMTEQDAVATLQAQDVPYSITNRAGSPGGTCTVTAQQDRGYRTEVEMEYDHDDKTWDRTETEVWRGVGLTVVCR